MELENLKNLMKISFNKLDCFVVSTPRNDVTILTEHVSSKPSRHPELVSGSHNRQSVRCFVLHTQHDKYWHILPPGPNNDKNLVPQCPSALVTSKKSSQKPQKAAFTLAEVLITLGIIGIVAALSIPALIENHKKQETVTKLKKAYTEISQALQRAEVDNGMMETWDFYEAPSDVGRVVNFSENNFFPYIKIAKKCIPSSSECWSGTVNSLDNVVYSDLGNGKSTHFSFLTTSGYAVYYWLHGRGNGAWFYVDINGPKRPNVLGKDVFAFFVSWGNNGGAINNDPCSKYRAGVYPYGLACDINYTRENFLDADLDEYGIYKDKAMCAKFEGNKTGIMCSALIMHDGWKIEKDYPW